MKKLFRYLGISLGLWLLLEGCEETLPNITPTGELTFYIVDANGDPVPNARVYLFGAQSAYTAYLQANPNGDPSITPTLSPENIGTANASGIAQFNGFELDGPFYSSGNTHFYNPNPIYYRVEGSLDGSTFMTNDQGPIRLEFDELESGASVAEDIDVVIE